MTDNVSTPVLVKMYYKEIANLAQLKPLDFRAILVLICVVLVFPFPKR